MSCRADIPSSSQPPSDDKHFDCSTQTYIPASTEKIFSYCFLQLPTQTTNTKYNIMRQELSGLKFSPIVSGWTLISITCSWYLISKSRLEGRGGRSWLWPCQNTGNIVSALPSPLLTLLHHFEVWLGRISSEGETNTGLVPPSITNLDITKTLIFQTCWEPHKTFCLSSQSLLIIIAKLVQHNTFSSKGHNYF